MTFAETAALRLEQALAWYLPDRDACGRERAGLGHFGPLRWLNRTGKATLKIDLHRTLRPVVGDLRWASSRPETSPGGPWGIDRHMGDCHSGCVEGRQR